MRKHVPKKPALIAEFGLADTKWGRSDYMKQDTEGVHFHTSLWASAFAGTSGTVMFWWWELLDQQNAYKHYRPLSAFLADICFVGLQPGKYQLEWWDTYEGRSIRTEQVSYTQEPMQIAVPSSNRDIACRINK